MKVRELIEALKLVDPNLDVVNYVGDFGYDKVSELELVYLGAKVSNKFADYDSVEPFMPGAFEAVWIR